MAPAVTHASTVPQLPLGGVRSQRRDVNASERRFGFRRTSSPLDALVSSARAACTAIKLHTTSTSTSAVELRGAPHMSFEHFADWVQSA